MKKEITHDIKKINTHTYVKKEDLCTNCVYSYIRTIFKIWNHNKQRCCVFFICDLQQTRGAKKKKHNNNTHTPTWEKKKKINSEVKVNNLSCTHYKTITLCWTLAQSREARIKTETLPISILFIVFYGGLHYFFKL